MIDNFWFLEERVNDLASGEFFPLMILKRKKDNPELDKNCKVIYRTNIYCLKDIYNCKDKLIKTCIEQNARIYVKINKRCDELVSETLVKYVLDRHLKKEFKFVREAYDHCVGISDASKIRYYLIDVDIDTNVDDSEKEIGLAKAVKEINESLENLKFLKRMKDYPIYKLNTKNGIHFIAPSFDTEMFKDTINKINKSWPSITTTVNKDADTLIYIP